MELPKTKTAHDSKIYGGLLEKARLMEWSDSDGWLEVTPKHEPLAGVISLVLYNGTLLVKSTK